MLQNPHLESQKNAGASLKLPFEAWKIGKLAGNETIEIWKI